MVGVLRQEEFDERGKSQCFMDTCNNMYSIFRHGGLLSLKVLAIVEGL